MAGFLFIYTNFDATIKMLPIENISGSWIFRISVTVVI